VYFNPEAVVTTFLFASAGVGVAVTVAVAVTVGVAVTVAVAVTVGVAVTVAEVVEAVVVVVVSLTLVSELQATIKQHKLTNPVRDNITFNIFESIYKLLVDKP
jgi:hypothetical protein